MPIVTSMSGKEREKFALPTKPEKGHAGNIRTKNVVSMSKKTTSVTNTCLLHGPGHSSEDCKLLKEYINKYAAQHP